MKITGIRLVTVKGTGKGSWPGKESSPVRPYDLYPEYRRPKDGERKEWQGEVAITRSFIEILTDTGPVGRHGPLSRELFPVIKAKLLPLIIGHDPLRTEMLWEGMFLRSHSHRSGLIMTAISAIDCALWDLKGRFFGAPVYSLLGGPTRLKIDAYVSTLGFSTEEPELIRERVERFGKMGFAGQKWFFAHGPHTGALGRKKNLELMRTVRETAGADGMIMFDCYGGWDVPYALAMLKDLETCSPAWLEEPLPATDLDGYGRIRRATALPLGAGESLYTRFEVRPYLERGLLDYIQPDIDWTGGITEMIKICALAASYNVKVLPHGTNLLPALHIAASRSPALCPMVEYLYCHLQQQNWFLANPPVLEGGSFSLPDRPGLGIDIDAAKIETKEEEQA